MVVVEPIDRPHFFVGAAVGLPNWLCFIGALVGLAIGGAVSTGREIAVDFSGLFL